ncbi:MAG: helix-turn-helix transcriptional regulator [Planctomycetota bacterium]|nr:WYL domain-containing protein [Planctomycetota bacterium]
MSDSVPKFERLMNLVAFLLASSEPIPFSEIRKGVIGYNDRAREDAVEKRFDRDKKELREMGIPVEYVAGDEHGREGYFIPLQEYFHRELDLLAEEAALLAILGNAARGSNDAISFNLRSAHLKLAIDAPISDSMREQVPGRMLFSFSRGRRDRATLDNLDRLGQAIVSRRTVVFKYRKPQARKTEERRLHPYGLGYREGEWYLVGSDLDRDDIRQFKVLRIQGTVRVSRERRPEFQVPTGFKIEHYIERAPWEFAGGKEEWAQILFGSDVAWMVEEAKRPGQKFERRPDGSGVLSLKVRRSPETHQRLLSFLSSYSADCAILKPAWLRKQAHGHLQELKERYV